MLLVAGSFLVSLGAAEIYLRSRLFDSHYIWTPFLEREFAPEPGVMPGVEGPSRFTVNALGLRGAPPGADVRLKILALGGSTTECLYLDDLEAWTSIASARISDANGAKGGTWIGNGGRSGLKAEHHLAQIRVAPEMVPNLDAVLVLVGINDVVAFLKYPGQRPASEAEIAKLAFRVSPEGLSQTGYPWHKRTALWSFARRLYYRSMEEGMRQPESGATYDVARQQRADAKPFLDVMPSAEEALATYSSTLLEIVRAARSHGLRLVLVTQPVLWKAENSPAEESALWFGGSPAGYYSSAVLFEAMQSFNEELRKVCAVTGCELIDLARELPATLENYYDDCHFTEIGSSAVADIIATHF